MARAGFCSACNANVWLNADGSCVNGHPASCVTGVYEPGPGQPVQPAPKSHTGLIIGIVAAILGAFLLCGLLVVVVLPSVFLNTSSNAQLKSCQANMRTVIGAGQAYRAANPDATLPSDWDEQMAVLIPDYIKSEPTCPGGGTYSFSDPQDQFSLTCSIHGRVPGFLP